MTDAYDTNVTGCRAAVNRAVVAERAGHRVARVVYIAIDTVRSPSYGSWIMFRDLRHGLRSLLQAKGWTAVVVISLALGIGANTALFSAVNGLLLKKIPVKDPDTLVRLRGVGRNQMATSSSDYGFANRDAYGTASVRTTFSYPMYQQFRASNQTMSDLFACAPFGRVNVVVDGQADIAASFISSGNYYQVLGVPVLVGRTIVPDDDRPGAPPVALLSHKYWRSRFAGDRAAVGKSIRINNVPVTVVGVLPDWFTGIQQISDTAPDVSVPLALDSLLSTGLVATNDSAAAKTRLEQPTYWWLQVMGRLKPGVTPAQVQANLAGVFQHTARAGFESYLASLPESGRSASYLQNRTEVSQLRAEPGNRGVYDVNANDLRAVTILTIVVALVLLIVCANVANLLLSRATARQKEISVRLSLGATRGRLIRQLLTESLVLASLGGVLGVLVGYWGKQLLPGAPGQATAIDWRVLAFVVAVTTLTGVVFGLAPAVRATGMNVSRALKDTSRSVAGGRSFLSRALLILQVAISLVLLVGAGLFLGTVQNLRHVDVGFDPSNLVLFRVNPQLNRYDDNRIRALYGDMLNRLQTVSSVRGAALSQPALLSGGVSSTGIFVQGRTYAKDEQPDINIIVASPSFFETMKIPLVLGRGLTARDVMGAREVAVINEAAVRKYFPHENPIGRRFGWSVENSGKTEIVGVLKDAKYNDLREAAPPTMYVPYLQRPVRGGVVFEVRTAGDPLATIGAIRETVRQVDPNLPIMDVSTQMEQIGRRFMQEKLFAQAYALFGGLALLIASVGLFGLMSYSVARRTGEIGIRMALGAQREDVLRLVMRESMTLVSVGVVVGLVAALAASRFIATLLFGLAPTDARSIAVAVTAMIGVSAVAGYLPARRASRVDPMIALHYE